jgi:hypothetical protein
MREDEMKNNLKPKIYEKYPTIAAFSQVTKIRENRISQIITGRTNPSKAEQKAIAKRLGCQVNEVFPEN